MIIIDDYYWQLLMIINDYWWLSMIIINDYWWLLMMIIIDDYYGDKTNFSSSINDVIRPGFFYDKISQVQKSTKKH